MLDMHTRVSLQVLTGVTPARSSATQRTSAPPAPDDDFDYAALLADADAASAPRHETPKKAAPTTADLLALADGSRTPVEDGRKP